VRPETLESAEVFRRKGLDRMSRRLRVPSYRLHKQSGQAVITLTNGLGTRRDVLLGKYGTPESRSEYARVIAEWEAAGRTLAAPGASPPPQASLSVNEAILLFWKHAEQHYRHRDGTPTNELNDFRLSLKPLRELYGHTPAKDFGPLALKAVRERMIESGLCRGVVNQRVGRVRRMFRWCVENELVPSSVLEGLRAVRGLEKGRSRARETEPVKPVPPAFVEAVLPFLRPAVAAMVQLQLHSGMRPGEVVRVRGVDIDMTGKVWLYRPGSDMGPEGEHKTAHRGHGRVVPLGPRCQEIIREYLKPDVTAYLFQPRETMEAFRAEQRRNRKTKVQPSQIWRKKARPKRKPGERYSVGSYARAVRRACVKAGVPHWHPHQLRHTKATEIRREAGLDAARAVLGHRTPTITETYAEIDQQKAAAVMEKLG
jgi:integrase